MMVALCLTSWSLESLLSYRMLPLTSVPINLSKMVGIIFPLNPIFVRVMRQSLSPNSELMKCIIILYFAQYTFDLLNFGLSSIPK